MRRDIVASIKWHTGLPGRLYRAIAVGLAAIKIAD